MMEVNSFNPIKAGCDNFRRNVWLEGDQLETIRSTALEISGFYDYLKGIPEVEIVPGFFANAESAGMMAGNEFEKLSGFLFNSLRQAGKVDAVLLSLHGAMQSDTIDDCEGYILEQIREITGDDVPITASLDLHACLTKKMLKYLDSFAAYLTMPHSDTKETGLRAAQTLLNLLCTGIKPAKLLKRIPLVMPLQNSNTSSGPLEFVMERFRKLLIKPGVLSAGLFLTQPWLDTPELGCELCLFFDDEERRSEFESDADEVLNMIWDKRCLFYPEIPDIDTAIKLCEKMEKPVCLVDLGDSVPAGSTGDSTVALRALLQTDTEVTSCIVLKDPDTVKKALNIGVDGVGLFSIGGSDKEGFNYRTSVEARVIVINPEPYRCLGPLYEGLVINPGVRALLCAGNIFIIACENACTSYDRNMLITMGLDPAQMGIIVQKASNSFKSTYKDVMRSYIYAQTPGYSDPIQSRLSFKHIERPIYPFDDM